MDLPSWTDSKLGTMKRAALWLVTVVGEGNVFTKEDVKAAFPGVSQADRRVRDLRDHGWQIDTNREDASLGQHEQRFVRPGEAVWEPGKGSRPSTSITQTQRREVLSKDGHFCRSCGITPGETYAGTYETAQLDIARRLVKQPDGSERTELVTECNRCRVGGRGKPTDLAAVLSAVDDLGSLERKMLAAWVASDKREFSAVERLWADYRTLPAESRAQVRKVLALPAG
jgi:5-methylcytosine-specific restriction endonuclease McrA